MGTNSETETFKHFLFPPNTSNKNYTNPPPSPTSCDPSFTFTILRLTLIKRDTEKGSFSYTQNYVAQDADC